jgi:hypothetical protein
LLEGIGHQMEAVRAAVGDGPPIHPLLCFIDAEWGVFARPFTLNGVQVCWPRALYKGLRRAGSASAETVAEVATRLASHLPPAQV